jgi:signal transduction histidine kinase
MKLWLRIFLLSAIVSLVAVSTIGVVTLRTGYASLVQNAVRELARDTDTITKLIARQWDVSSLLSSSFPANDIVSPQDVSSLSAFLDKLSAILINPDMEVELRSVRGELFFSSGSHFSTLGAGDRPELETAMRGGTAYILRRLSGKLGLYLSGPVRIRDVDIIMSVASDMGALDSFWNMQVSVILASSFSALILLLGSSLLASRAIAKRLERLAHGASAIAEGDYSSRVEEGRDEVGMVASRFNQMALTVETTVGRLRAEKEDRQRFIDSLTHELRTPVASIVGYADLLRLRTWDEKVFAKGLGQIQAAGKRILALIESLAQILLSRAADREWPPVEMAPYLAQFAERACDLVRPRALSIRVDADPGALAADPGILDTLLHNLVENSSRFSPPGAAIVIGFRNADGERGLFVRDFGPGMTEAEMAHAGEPFYRGRGQRGEGFGLGLAMCREIAARLGAALVIERPPDGGLMVRVAFPRLQ